MRAGLFAGCAKCVNSASVSAICGTFSLWTKEPTWTMSTREAMSASIQAIFCSVGTVVFSICSPSLGPTSWMIGSAIVVSAKRAYTG